jgi:hypothetical protein
MNDGDYTKTFIQQLAKTSFLFVISENHNLYGVLSDFAEGEGWYEMDGSYGIKIISVDDVEFNEDEFEITQKKEEADDNQGK